MKAVTRTTSSALLACAVQTVAAQATAPATPAADKESDWSVTLRAANEPSSKDKAWDRGATFAYQSVNGASTVQADVVLKLARKIDTPLSRKKGETGGSLQVTLEPAAYLHRSNSASKPQNDRGLSLGLSFYIEPPSGISGPPITYDVGLTASAGKSLKQGSGAFASQFFDADSTRLVGHAMVYYSPSKGVFDPAATSKLRQYFVGTAKIYGDRVSGAQNATANGTVSGTSFAIQYSVAPFGTDPKKNTYMGFGFAPSFSLLAQRQRDSSATGGRVKDSRTLYSLTATFPLTPTDTGIAPSIDISRSVGSDVLQGREDRAETRIAVGFKF